MDPIFNSIVQCAVIIQKANESRAHFFSFQSSKSFIFSFLCLTHAHTTTSHLRVWFLQIWMDLLTPLHFLASLFDWLFYGSTFVIDVRGFWSHRRKSSVNIWSLISGFCHVSATTLGVWTLIYFIDWIESLFAHIFWREIILSIFIVLV